MKIFSVIAVICLLICCLSFNLQQKKYYRDFYARSVDGFDNALQQLLTTIDQTDMGTSPGRQRLKEQIHLCRRQMKPLDFWFRYFEPNMYRRINGPLPVEWENEVFEKFEPPYKREGAGLSLAEKYLDEDVISRDSLKALVRSSAEALATFRADSVTSQLDSYHHFYLANRLYLLNLAALYTTGFECPDTSAIIPELRSMMTGVKKIYTGYNEAFPAQPLPQRYVDLYDQAIAFANKEPDAFTSFDHFRFIKDFINPLFGINQGLIRSYSVITRNYNDFTLNNDCNSIFDKTLYSPQNSKGIFSFVEDPAVLQQIRETGRSLFYDPILSANNQRSCASCHKPTEYFTDTTTATALQFDRQGHLPRNTPTLINVVFNHLIMLDGKHISLQDQARDVMHNPAEMNNDEKELVRKVMSCRDYREAFRKFLRYTPEEKEVSLQHIISAITYYYSGYSYFQSPFDEAINNQQVLPPETRRGFNLFMGKAQCGTCHFLPLFNGVKPPYIGSEFEVIGVPEDSAFRQLSPDKGRYGVNPAPETLHAFRTGTLRNAEFTKPYMHNGVFRTLEQVIDFYDTGGGVGKKLAVPNQSLSPDSLKLTRQEKNELLAFMRSLNENIIFEPAPASLPVSGDKELNRRKPGGEY